MATRAELYREKAEMCRRRAELVLQPSARLSRCCSAGLRQKVLRWKCEAPPPLRQAPFASPVVARRAGCAVTIRLV